MPGVPASDTIATSRPARRASRIRSPFQRSLCSKYEVVGVAMAWLSSRRAVRRVSSQATRLTVRRTRMARSERSSRLPIGVATTNRVPGPLGPPASLPIRLAYLFPCVSDAVMRRIPLLLTHGLTHLGSCPSIHADRDNPAARTRFRRKGESFSRAKSTIVRGVTRFGRDQGPGGRIDRERPPALQAEGPARGHHQGYQEAQLLLEARRQAPGQAGAGPQEEPQEDPSRKRIAGPGRRGWPEPDEERPWSTETRLWCASNAIRVSSGPRASSSSTTTRTSRTSPSVARSARRSGTPGWDSRPGSGSRRWRPARSFRLTPPGLGGRRHRSPPPRPSPGARSAGPRRGGARPFR